MTRPTVGKGKTTREVPKGAPIVLADLKAIPAFAALEDADAGKLLAVMSVRPVARGEPIFREGEVGDGLYAVLSGRVSITKKNAKGGEREVAILERHEVLGEMDLISDRPHTAGAKGNESAVLLFLPKGEFQAMLAAGSPGAAAMVKYFAVMLAGRLDANNRRMMEMLDNAPKQEGTEFAEFKRRLLKEWTF